MIGRIRRFAAVAAVAVALLGISTTTAQATTTRTTVAHPAVGYSVQGWARASSGLSVRSGPGTGFLSLGSLPYNTLSLRIRVRLLALHRYEHQHAGHALLIHRATCTSVPSPPKSLGGEGT